MHTLAKKSQACTLIIIIIVGWLQSSLTLRILGIFPTQCTSHSVLHKRLMRGLAELGHRVDVYSQFPLKSSVPNYTDFNLVGPTDVLQNNMTYDASRAIDGSWSTPVLVSFFESLCQLMHLPVFRELIKNPPQHPPYDLVIVEVFLYDCYLAWGRHLGVPMIGLLPLPSWDYIEDALGSPINPAVQSSVLSRFAAPMTFFERVQSLLLTNHVKLSHKYYVSKQDEIVRKLFGSDFPSVLDLPNDLALLLTNHHPALYGMRAFPQGIVPIAGLHISDTGDVLPKKVQQLLDESKDGFVYVSFGSMVRIETFPESTIKAFYDSFENIKPVRVLMKIAKPEELPKDLPSNVITHHWLPQVKVLKHKNIKAFVTHGGAMSTQESVYFGVPIIGFPLFGDQYFNIESFVKRNLAINIDYNDVNEQVLTKALVQVLNNPVYKKSAEKVGEMFRDNPMSPMDTAAYWIEYIARHGKDSMRSPIVGMPWWQSSLLDVYAFLTACILIACCVVRVVAQKLMLWIFAKRTARFSTKVKRN